MLLLILDQLLAGFLAAFTGLPLRAALFHQHVSVVFWDCLNYGFYEALQSPIHRTALKEGAPGTQVVPILGPKYTGAIIGLFGAPRKRRRGVDCMKLEDEDPKG